MRKTGTVNRKTGLFNSATRASRRRAGLILAVLLAHLLFMSSPLHDAMLGHQEMLGAEPTTAAMAQSDSGQYGLVELDTATHHEYHGHCGIEWTTASSGVAPVSPDAVVVVTTVSGLDVQRAVTPIVRAIGPPVVGDPQALLQVFRL